MRENIFIRRINMFGQSLKRTCEYKVFVEKIELRKEVLTKF
jgi:hypothetical protein